MHEKSNRVFGCFFVAGPRIELGTSWLWIMRSNQLSYPAFVGTRFSQLLYRSFLERGCKGTTFFWHDQIFLYFFVKILLECLFCSTFAVVLAQSATRWLNYPTWVPFLTGAVTVVTTNLPSASTADRIIPCDSTPIILRGGKLAINSTCLPTKTDGSG